MRPYKLYTDSELLDLLKSDDRHAFAEIHYRYWEVMYRHALKMLGEEDDAKDVVQDLFANLWVKGKDIVLSTSLSGYLYISVRNKIINIIHQKAVRKDYLSSLALYAEETRNTILDQITEKEMLRVVEKQIQNLPQKMRHIFELSRHQNLSHKEIANQLEISDKTVKKQIGYAIKIIRLRLDVLTRMVVFLIASAF
ncbi:RNA polymerase sigma-70 factor [Daejeonella sp. JGW-45]|uniref:RNA polymerase sigma factor n=1 Tax=Daejeonella sp. JGW-45 TaxID=3034148 RepID=UPI0023EDDB63|nr:RNA polymerase sigma-70 factor [Daejeonella sp. JGW-45]